MLLTFFTLQISYIAILNLVIYFWPINVVLRFAILVWQGLCQKNCKRLRKLVHWQTKIKPPRILKGKIDSKENRLQICLTPVEYLDKKWTGNLHPMLPQGGTDHPSSSWQSEFTVPRVTCGVLDAFLLSVFNSQILMWDTVEDNLKKESYSQEQAASQFLLATDMKAQPNNRKQPRLVKTTSSLRYLISWVHRTNTIIRSYRIKRQLNTQSKSAISVKAMP